MVRKNGGIRGKEWGHSPRIPEHLREIPSEMIAEMQADAGLGVSTGLDEIIWTGGSDILDLDSALDKDLEDHDALEQILWALINRYPDVKPTGKPHKMKDPQIIRLERACYNLVGRKVKGGDAPTLDRSKLHEIAEQYWQTYGHEKVDDASQWEVIARIIVPNWREDGLSHKQVDNEIQTYVRAFNREKHKLLLRVSAKGLEQVEERKRKIEKVVSLMKELGIMDLVHTPSE